MLDCPHFQELLKQPITRVPVFAFPSAGQSPDLVWTDHCKLRFWSGRRRFYELPMKLGCLLPAIRAHFRKGVPVAQFWSLTLYSENTRRPYDNGGAEIKSISLDSRTEQLQYNEDGSVNLYIGAQAPEGLESNFMQTVAEDGWFVYFRLYAPTEPFFDKSYTLPDFEMID